MADEIDRANDMAELNLAASLAVRRSALVPCGRCHYCDESLRPNVLFCDKDCRDWFEQEQRINYIKGKS